MKTEGFGWAQSVGRRCLGMLLALFCCISATGWADLIPAWSEDPRAVHHVWNFPDVGLEPPADFSVNPFGTASVKIKPDDTFGVWQDPEEEIHSYGSEGDGAWQLGPGAEDSGRMDFSIPVADAGDTVDYAALYVNVDYLRDVPGHPLMEVDGNIVEFTNDQFSFTDPEKSLDNWWTRTWNVNVFGVSNPTVKMSIIGENDGALVDRVEINAIPEPHALVLLALGGGFLFMIRRMATRRGRR